MKMTPEEFEEFLERAAIMEYDGGLSRAEAEYQAYLRMEEKKEKKKSRE